jgi:hypothetical protein
MAVMKAELSVILLLFVYSSFAMPESYIASPLITPAPAFNANVIEKRAADQTCGYVNGDPSKRILLPALLVPTPSIAKTC